MNPEQPSEKPAAVIATHELNARAAVMCRHGFSAWVSSNSFAVCLFIAVALYLGLSLRILLASLPLTGTLTYPLDDPYIGMAMAKNFALHGVWGITPAHFSSSSSCPGFLLLLSLLYRLTGPTDWWPLVLSLGFGLLSLFLACRLLKDAGLLTQLLALCALIFFAPLHILGLLGMEHTLHIALLLTFLDLMARSFEKRQHPSWALLALTVLLVSVRFESLFLVAPACLLYLLERRLKSAILLGIAAALPVVIYGVVAVSLHSYWLSHSIALKGLSGEAALRSPLALVDHFVFSLARAPYLGLFLAMILVLLSLPRVRTDKRAFTVLAIVLGAILFHLGLADIGWAYRYEAYLIASSVVAIAFAIPGLRISLGAWNAKLAMAALLVFGLMGSYYLTRRTIDADRTLPYRSLAVYSQQIQMARFLQRYEQGASIAANDVGAINYYANINCLDLAGLADQEVFALKQTHAYTTDAIAKLAAERQVKIAMVYDTWFSVLPLTGLRGLGGPPLPPSWIRVARWHTPYGQYLGGDVVSFYATDASAAAQLRDSLTRFAPSLPSQVEVLWN